MVHCVIACGDHDLMQFGRALLTLSDLPGAHQYRKENGDEQRDDPNHDQKFDERESPGCVHRGRAILIAPSVVRSEYRFHEKSLGGRLPAYYGSWSICQRLDQSRHPPAPAQQA
jgi:hypothetical protein